MMVGKYTVGDAACEWIVDGEVAGREGCDALGKATATGLSSVNAATGVILRAFPDKGMQFVIKITKNAERKRRMRDLTIQ
jgi:hypothetical protein